jgi:hypothetical protein
MLRPMSGAPARMPAPLRLSSLLALVALPLVTVACGRGGDARQGRERTSRAETAGADPSDPASPALPPETHAGEGGGLAVHGDPSRPGRAVGLRVANTGSTTLSIDSALAIEHESGGRFAPLEGMGRVTLRGSCTAAAPRCVTLAPGAEIFPPDWLGTTGDAQCACEECGPAPAGRYRFIAKSCDGAKTYAGEPFAIE